MASKDITIQDLLFDLGNPRFPGLQSQREALESIVADQKDKLLALAEDITDVGLDLSDRPIVMAAAPPSSAFIVLEGNRRLAALKLLTNEKLVDSLNFTDKRKQRWKDLISRFDATVIEPVDCVLVDSREEANHWIELKHTGENAGRGRVGWDGIATAQFRGKEVSLQALEFVRRNNAVTPEVSASLGSKFPITNLDRLLGNPDVRQGIGLSISSDGKLQTTLEPDELARVLGKVISDIATRSITVNHIRTKADQLDYIKNLEAEFKPDTSKIVAKPIQVDTATTSGNPKPAPAPSKPKPRVKPQSADRPKLIPTSCILQISIPRINAIYNELRKNITVESAPNAAAVLLRVFLELSLDQYIDDKKITGVNPDSKLSQKLDAVANYLEANNIATKHELKPIRVAVSAPSSSASPNTFNSYVHNRHMIPNATDLKNTWDSIQVFFEKIWK